MKVSSLNPVINITRQNTVLSKSHLTLNENKSTVVKANSVAFEGKSVLNPQKPMTYSDKLKKDELDAASKLFMDTSKKFSLDIASDIIKTKLDSQLMLYSEKDIEKIVKTVMAQNPETTREEVLQVMARISSFSNYESLSNLEEFLQKENINSFLVVNNLTVNNIFNYFAKAHKGLLSWRKTENSVRRCIVLDRTVIENLKNHKSQNDCTFRSIVENIAKGKIKIVLLDGWEAKTSKGVQSFNILGSWGDLSSMVNNVLKDEKRGVDSFNDDIISDLKNLFGDNIEYTVIKNPIKTLDEKSIAERLNAKSISKNEIKDFIIGLSSFAAPDKGKPKFVRDFDSDMSGYNFELSRNIALLKNKNISEDKIQKSKEMYIQKILGKYTPEEKVKTSLQEQIAKIIYCTINVYSPRRIASELKILHSKIDEKVNGFYKSMDDAIFILGDSEKSYGLINYQYSKVNNIPSNKILYIYNEDTKIDKAKKDGKFFVYLDDFSGSGKSLTKSPFSYIGFRLRNPSQPFIFAPLSYTKQALSVLNRAIFSAKMDLRQKVVNDCVVGVTEISDTDDYMRLLPPNKRQLLKYCFKKGFEKGSSVVGFPHVIPDNCSDVAGMLLENILRNNKSNKAKIGEFKKEAIIYIKNTQNN